MPRLAALESALARVWRALAVAANAALLLIMLAVAADALMRYVFGKPIAGVLEGVELLMVLVVYVGLARTQAERGHIAVGLLTDRLAGRARAAMAAVASLLALSLFAALTWATTGMALRSWEIGEYSAGLVPFPLYPARSLVALGCLFVCIELAVELVRAVADFSHGKS